MGRMNWKQRPDSWSEWNGKHAFQSQWSTGVSSWSRDVKGVEWLVRELTAGSRRASESPHDAPRLCRGIWMRFLAKLKSYIHSQVPCGPKQFCLFVFFPNYCPQILELEIFPFHPGSHSLSWTHLCLDRKRSSFLPRMNPNLILGDNFLTPPFSSPFFTWGFVFIKDVFPWTTVPSRPSRPSFSLSISILRKWMLPRLTWIQGGKSSLQDSSGEGPSPDGRAKLQKKQPLQIIRLTDITTLASLILGLGISSEESKQTWFWDWETCYKVPGIVQNALNILFSFTLLVVPWGRTVWGLES